MYTILYVHVHVHVLEVLTLSRARACAHDDVVPAVTGTGWRLGNCSMFSHELMLLTSLIVVNNALSRRWRPYSIDV